MTENPAERVFGSGLLNGSPFDLAGVHRRRSFADCGLKKSAGTFREKGGREVADETAGVYRYVTIVLAERWLSSMVKKR